MNVIKRQMNHQIKSIYDRRWLVQRYNVRSGQWTTIKVCWSLAEAVYVYGKHIQ